MIRVYKAVQLYISFKCLFKAPMNLALYKIYETFTSFKMLSVGCNYTVGQKLKKNQVAIPKIFILGTSIYHTRLWLVKNRLALSG